MKFRFCGGADVPEWVGAEIATIAKVSSVRIRLLAKKIVQMYIKSDQLGLDQGEVKQAADKLRGSGGGSDMSDGDISAIFAVLHHVITSAAKFDVDAPTLSLELQQLGLPRELSDALVRPYSDSRAALRDAGSRKTLRFPPLKVEHLGTQGEDLPGRGIVLELGDGNGAEKRAVVIPEAKLDLLIHELQEAQASLQDVV